MKNQDEKLTLKLRRDAIAKAKKVAKAKGTSLSRLVEGYFFQIAEPAPDWIDGEKFPITKALSGIIKKEKHTDFKKEYGKHLERKYGP